jgi:hypothetical protein
MPFFLFHSNGSESFEPRIESWKSPTPWNSDLAREINLCATQECEAGVRFGAGKDTCAPIPE